MQFPIDIPFHLFSSCIPVKGVLRSIIYDLQRNNFEYIPNSMYDVLMEFKNLTVGELIEKADNDEEKNILINYFDFLYKQEFIFFSKLESNLFPEYKIEFHKPYNFSCLIIDLNIFDFSYFEKLKFEISNSHIECIIFRFINLKEFEIENTLDYFNDIPVRTIQIFIDKNVNIKDSFFDKIISLNNRVTTILLYNSNKESYKNIKNGLLVQTKRDVINSKMSIISIADFDINIDLFMESKLFNNFYFKRVYINLIGDIFKTENDLTTFGNIKSTSLFSLKSDKKFQKFWNIKKDDISICKDCEYRYMCVDSRKPLFKNQYNLWVLEGTCNYDPYTSKWNNS